MSKGGAPKGNKNATKGKPVLAAIERALAQDNGKRLRAGAEKLLDAWAAGEPWAIKELGDRLDGKAHQSVSADISSDVTLKISKDDAGVL